jgi:hypothetical protein
MKKIIHVLIIMLFAVVQLTAQPIIKKQAIFGGTQFEYKPHIALLKNGGFVMAVTSYSDASGNKSENNRDSTRGTADYWIVTVDARGNIEWDKTYGGSSYDAPVSIITTRDNGYLVAGYSYSGISGDRTAPPRGTGISPDLWIIKLDSLGNKIWDKAYGGEDDEIGGSIKETNDGFILGGYSYSGISGDKTEASRGEYDYWVLKLDKQGNKVWDKTYGGNGVDRLQSIDITATGGYIFGGASSSGVSGEKTQRSRGGEDYWVIAVDKNGQKLWDKTFGGEDLLESLQCLQTTRDGGYILGGSSSSNTGIDKSENSKGGFDYWMIKLDASGKKVWDKTFGGSDGDLLYALQQTKDKGYVLAGHSYSHMSGDKTEPSRKGADYWVVKTDSLGKIKWDKTIGGSKEDVASDIKQVTPNDYIVAGSSWSKKSGDKTVPRLSVYSTDVWLVQLQAPPQAAIATQNIGLVKPVTETIFTLYPNPATDVLHIQTNGKTNFSLSNQAGKIMLTKTITNSGDIDVSQLPPGIYFLSNNTKDIKQKIIISR